MWTTQLPDRVEASPVVVADGAAVAVGCYDGFLYVLAASDGGIAWRYHLGDAVKCTVAVDPWDGLVWCGSHGRVLAHKRNGACEVAGCSARDETLMRCVMLMCAIGVMRCIGL